MNERDLPDVSTLSQPALIALRDQLVPVAAAAGRGGADISLSFARGTASAFITLLTEAQS